jgi:hypothetical protein
MFLVLTTPNNRDASASAIAPRYLGSDAGLALSCARNAQQDGEQIYVSTIIIYDLAPGRQYHPRGYLGNTDPLKSPYAYFAWQTGPEWVENFSDAFAAQTINIPRLSLLDLSGMKAAPGMYRTTVLLGSQYYQIGGDQRTFEEAMRLIELYGKTGHFQIFDDQGFGKFSPVL